uniref:Uncharacterized protein n=1 Tax=Rhizophora mucronata TaxID=61149 RepID=A0A2P2PEC1_RHIMU
MNAVMLMCVIPNMCQWSCHRFSCVQKLDKIPETFSR